MNVSHILSPYTPATMNKSSAVAETDDRARAKWAEKWGWAAVPLSVGELGPHLTQYRLGRGIPPYQVVSWSIRPFGHKTLTLPQYINVTDGQDIEDIRAIVTRNGRRRPKAWAALSLLELGQCQFFKVGVGFYQQHCEQRKAPVFKLLIGRF